MYLNIIQTDPYIVNYKIDIKMDTTKIFNNNTVNIYYLEYLAKIEFILIQRCMLSETLCRENYTEDERIRLRLQREQLDAFQAQIIPLVTEKQDMSNYHKIQHDICACECFYNILLRTGDIKTMDNVKELLSKLTFSDSLLIRYLNKVASNVDNGYISHILSYVSKSIPGEYYYQPNVYMQYSNL
jgi:hypothetical protein